MISNKNLLSNLKVISHFYKIKKRTENISSCIRFKYNLQKLLVYSTRCLLQITYLL